MFNIIATSRFPASTTPPTRPCLASAERSLNKEASEKTLQESYPTTAKALAVEKRSHLSHAMLISSYAESLLNFRGDLILELVGKGYRVTVLAPTASKDQVNRIRNLGAEFIEYSVCRNSLSILSDLTTFHQLFTTISREKPDCIIAYTIKPVVWTGISLLANKSIRFFPLITGLGYTFYGNTLKRMLIRRLASTLYRCSLQRAETVFFQNPDNEKTFRESGIVNSQRTQVLPGSGVNLERFPQKDLPNGETVFLMIARLLGEKGVREYVSAAKSLRQQGVRAQFRLAGPFDTSPDAIKASEVDQWIKQGAIIYLGPLEDVREELANCHVYVLPSYHEGLPRTVLEAMSTGRAVVTTNSPGCKETVVEGANGFLVDARDAERLMDRMLWFINNSNAIASMGRCSRQIASEQFNVKKVNGLILETIESVQKPIINSFLSTTFFYFLRTCSQLKRLLAS